eukprot:3833811-Alexandrium_andersonii.AAC.1
MAGLASAGDAMNAEDALMPAAAVPSTIPTSPVASGEVEVEEVRVEEIWVASRAIGAWGSLLAGR